MDHNLIIEHARNVATGASVPLIKAADFESAMQALAVAEAQSGESPEAAFVRLMKSDERMQALIEARATAIHGALQKAADQWREETALGARAEEVQKRMAKRDSAWASMEAYAKANALPDETDEAALARLLDSDETMLELYRQYEENR